MKRAIHRGWEHHAPSQRVACSLRCSQWRFTEKVVGKGDFECEGEFMFDAEVRTMNAFPSISFLFVSFLFFFRRVFVLLRPQKRMIYPLCESVNVFT